MNINLLIGILLLGAGAVLLFFGYNASQSVGEQVRETFTGRFSDSTTWYFVLGAVAALAGLVIVVMGSRA